MTTRKAARGVELVTMRTAAARLGLSRARLLELVERGALEVLTRGGVRQVPESEVQRVQDHFRKAEAEVLAQAQLERNLARVRAALARVLPRSARPTPTAFTFPAAARRMGLEVAQLRREVAAGSVLTMDFEFQRMVPASEVQRWEERQAERERRAAGVGA